MVQPLENIGTTNVKDNQQILDDIQYLIIPPNTWLFSTDAKAIYNNIDTWHTIEVLTWWFEDMAAQQELLPAFPLKAVIEAMTIIMTDIIFEYRDTYFVQILSIAMGTSTAVMWVTIYYAYHKEHCLISRQGAHLLYV